MGSNRASSILHDEGKAVRFPSPVPTPEKFFRIKWKEEFPCTTGIYLRRWYIEFPWFSIRLHHWLKSDDTRSLHDHPWWFFTLVLKGGYQDLSVSGLEPMKAGKLAFRKANHTHAVISDPGGCWTLLLTGSKTRYWGYWINEGKKFMKANKYFLTFKNHPCE